jgi:hypothetical protein
MRKPGHLLRATIKKAASFNVKNFQRFWSLC